MKIDKDTTHRNLKEDRMKHKIKAVRIIGFSLVLFFFASITSAEPVTIGAGAGYKRMLEEVFKQYESKTGQRVEQVYGHMGQIMMQAKTGEKIGLILGELSFLRSSDLAFSTFKEVGQGVLVLAYGKQVPLRQVDELTSANIQKIAMPDAKQAIYGKAALEFLTNSGLNEKLQNKLVTVATVPQVSSYLISKDAEAGFINITDAIYIQDKIGGWIEIDKSQYSPIQLAIGIVKGFENKPEIKQLVEVITTDGDIKAIMKKAGIK